MRKVILSLVASAAIAAPLSAATTQKKASHSTHPAAKSSSRTSKTATAKSATRSTSAKGTAAKTTAAKGKSKSKSKTVRQTARSYQQAPTPERYQEIQQALTKKGFFQGEASGKWGTDSAEALKRFQAEQNLTPDGKINSLSLIALGLGPKRLSAQSKSGSSTPSPTPAPQ